MLTTKLFCGNCGRLMAGESGKSCNGSVYHYYKCSGAKRKLGCHKKPVRKHWIEGLAVRLTIEKVLNDAEISRIADAILELQSQEDTTLPALKSQLRDCENAIENMLNAIQMGIVTASTKTRLEKLEKQKEELQVSILQAQLQRPNYTKEQIVSWINRFKYGKADDPNYQRQMIDTFLNAIYVYDDTLVFTYNFKDGTETMSLDDAEAVFSSDLSNSAPPKINATPDGVAFIFFLRLGDSNFNAKRRRRFGGNSRLLYSPSLPSPHYCAYSLSAPCVLLFFALSIIKAERLQHPAAASQIRSVPLPEWPLSAPGDILLPLFPARQ